MQHWFGAAGEDEETDEDLAALGLMPEAIEDLRRKRRERDFEVWQENWDIVGMFFKMQTQWVMGFSGPTGLHYPSLEWLCRLYGVEDPVTMFEGVQTMEAAALAEMNKEKS